MKKWNCKREFKWRSDQFQRNLGKYLVNTQLPELGAGEGERGLA